MNGTPNETLLSNRDRIIEATRELIALKGVNHTSLADVARKVQISKGTLFHYYPSKSHLIYDIVETHFRQLTGSMIARLSEYQDGADPFEAVRMIFQTLLNEENLGRLNLYLTQEALLENHEIKEKFAEQYRAWRTTIAQQIQRLTGSGPNPGSVKATLVLALIDGLTIQWLLDAASIDLDEIAREISSIIAGR